MPITLARDCNCSNGKSSGTLTVVKTLHRIHLAAARLRLWADGVLRDPIADRLESERRRDGQMFRRHRAFLPWAP